MPPRARKTAEAAAPADLNGKRPANATSDLDALRTEVANEASGTVGVLTVPLADTTVRVKDFLDWPSSANEDLAYGRLTSWASKVVIPEDFTKIWAPMDPTNRQAIEFMAEWEKISGIPLGTLLTSLTS